jgi:hypothetical protein
VWFTSKAPRPARARERGGKFGVVTTAGNARHSIGHRGNADGVHAGPVRANSP